MKVKKGLDSGARGRQKNAWARSTTMYHVPPSCFRLTTFRATYGFGIFSGGATICVLMALRSCTILQ